MQRVFTIGDHIINALGEGTQVVFSTMLSGETGVLFHHRPELFIEPFWGALVPDTLLEQSFSTCHFPEAHTRFEKMCLLSAQRAIDQSGIDPSSKDTLFVLSTTKGNIDLLAKDLKEQYPPERQLIWHTAQRIAAAFNNPHRPLIISNACISGVVAIIAAHDYLKRGHYKNAVVIGADIATEFVISGFQSFKSLGNGPCKPFDLNRDGLNLGEGAATLVLTTDETLGMQAGSIEVLGGATANDANHISGPSRTGEGLFLAVQRALHNSGVTPEEVGYISAHGTATPFNDEMESKAFAWAGLSHPYLNSMKAYFGHTLGAAGIMESVIAIQGMKKNVLLKTLGFQEYGVPEKVNVLDQNVEVPVNVCLKTASGFGGCNGAVLFRKNEQPT